MTKKKISLVLVLSLMISILSFTPAFADDNIDFNFSKTPAKYDVLEAIEGEGKVKIVGKTQLARTVTYTVESKDGLSIFKLGQDTILENGDFKVDFRLPRNMKNGTYYLRMNIGGVHKTYDFEISGGIEGKKPEVKENPVIKTDGEGNVSSNSPSISGTTSVVPTPPTGVLPAVTEKEEKKDDEIVGEGKDSKLHFKDVEKHWAKKEIEDLVGLKIVNGVSDKEFQPNRNITRAEFTKIMVEALKLDLVEEESRFKDVKTSDWYSKYVETAVKHKLVKGISKDEFAPNKEITREEMSAIIYRAIEDKKDTDYKNDFKDKEKISNWAMDSIDYISEIGIVKGDNQNRFSPKKPATRAESSVMIWRFLQK